MVTQVTTGGWDETYQMRLYVPKVTQVTNDTLRLKLRALAGTGKTYQSLFLCHISTLTLYHSKAKGAVL